MSLTRQQKEKTISKVQEDIKSSGSAVLLSFNKLTVEDINNFRDNLASKRGAMRVIPKRLLKIALENLKLNFNPSEHEGQIATIWGEDEVTPAKTTHEFSKGKDDVQLLAGVLNGNLLSGEEVTSLAKLPSLEELQRKLVGVLSGPACGFVSVLSGAQSHTVQVLRAISEQKQTS